MNDSPYVSAAKYAFMIIGGGALAAALVRGSVAFVKKGLQFMQPSVPSEPVTSEPEVLDPSQPEN